MNGYVPKKCKEYLHNCRVCHEHFHKGHDNAACPKCGADLTCGHWAVPGFDYCERHGGPAPSRGFYWPGRAVVSGEDSRFPLTKVAAQYVKMREDGRWLSNRATLEILDHRIVQLLERIDANEAPERLANLALLWASMRAAMRNNETIEIELVAKKIDAEFEAAHQDWMSWHQMFEIFDLRRKMNESEAKILKDLKAMITAEDAHEFAAKLLAANIDAVNSAPISDEAKVYLLKRINYDFGRITGYGSGQQDPDGLERSDRETIDA